MAHITGKTSSGFSFDIPDERFDDMELVDLVGEAEDGNIISATKAMKILLGVQGKKELYESCRDASGKVPASVVLQNFSEIMLHNSATDSGDDVAKNC